MKSIKPATAVVLGGVCLLAGIMGCSGRKTGQAMAVAPRKPRLEVQGHRGCRGLRPENTLAGFRHAVRLGVDVLELDLGLSKDGVLVVAHDPAINDLICSGAERLPSRLLRDLSWDQIKTLDCGTKKNPRFPDQAPAAGERMPRLEQVFALLDAHAALRANIEIKTAPETRGKTRPPADFAAALVKLVRARGLALRVIVQSFDPAALQAVTHLAPKLTLAALVDRRAEIAPMLKATGAMILSPRFSEIDAALVKEYQRQGLRVIPWTVNEPDDMRRLIGWGVDGIITDRPDRLLKLVGR
jgi:glycerophosphoryl diester phosphodiesterase